MNKLSRKDLSEQNGQDGKKTFISYEGCIYDLTVSAKWKNGTHMGRHKAGMDLTNEMKAAPHGPEVFENFEQVGLCPAEPAAGGPQAPWPLSVLYEKVPFIKRHSHPFSVHYPLAFMMGSALFVLLYHWLGLKAFDTTAFHLMALGTMTVPIAILTGLQSWWLFYGLAKSKGIVTKLILAPLLFVLGLVVWVMRATNPEVLTGGGSEALIYTALVLLVVPVVGIIGFIGGQITFPE